LWFTPASAMIQAGSPMPMVRPWILMNRFNGQPF
jgi:hypothetical protein